MSHEVLEPLLEAGLLPQLSSLCSNILSFHRHARKDIPDLVAGCFRNGKYFKLPEFYSMFSRLDRGHAGWSAAFLLASEQMSQGEMTGLEARDWDTANISTMMCNDDKSAIPDWSALAPPLADSARLELATKRATSSELSSEQVILCQKRQACVKAAQMVIKGLLNGSMVESFSQDGLDPILCQVLLATTAVTPAEAAEAEAAQNPEECITKAVGLLQDKAWKACEALSQQYSGVVCNTLFSDATELLMGVLPVCLLCMQAWHRQLKPAKGKGKKSKQACQTPEQAAEQAARLESIRGWHAAVSVVLADVGSAIGILQAAINLDACADENQYQQLVTTQVMLGYKESCVALAGLVKRHTTTLKSLKM